MNRVLSQALKHNLEGRSGLLYRSSLGGSQLFKAPARQFSTEPKNERPRVFEFSAPKDDNYKNFESTKEFTRRYFILFPVALIALYNMAFSQKNEISRKTELKLFSTSFENLVIAPYLSRRIMKAYDGCIFKQDTEETEKVKAVLTKLIEANNLQKYINPAKLTVKVLHDSSVVEFMNKDSTFYITSKAVEICEEDERMLALLVGHELSYMLLGYFPNRIVGYLINKHILSKNIFNEKSHEVYDPTREAYKKQSKVQEYSSFYPQQRYENKFQQRFCDSFAVKLFRTAYEETTTQEEMEAIVEKLYGPEGSLTHELETMPYLDWLDKEKKNRRSELYSYKRYETVKKLMSSIIQNEEPGEKKQKEFGQVGGVVVLK